MYLQVLFLNALSMSIYQFLDSKTLSHIVVLKRMGVKTFQQNLNSTFYLTNSLFDYGCCPLDCLKWNWALINVRYNSSLDVRHSLNGKAFFLKEN